MHFIFHRPCWQSGWILILYVQEKHILLYFKILKPATLRSAEIYSILEDCQTDIFQVLFSTRLVIFSDFKELQGFQVMFSTLFVCYLQWSVRRIFSKHWFPQDWSFFQISRNCKYSKSCFPHFLFDIHCQLCQTNIFKVFFPQDLSFFSDFQELQIFQVMFPHCLFDIPSSVRWIFSKYLFPQILRDWKKIHKTCNFLQNLIVIIFSIVLTPFLDLG